MAGRRAWLAEGGKRGEWKRGKGERQSACFFSIAIEMEPKGRKKLFSSFVLTASKARPGERRGATMRGQRRPRGRGRRAKKRRGGRRERACCLERLGGKREAMRVEEGKRLFRKKNKERARRPSEKFATPRHNFPLSSLSLSDTFAFAFFSFLFLFSISIAMRSSSMASTAGSSSRAARRSTAVVPMALFSRKSSTAVVDAPPAKGRKG